MIKEFYQQLQSLLNKLKPKDIIILMGDFNAKIGADNTGCEEIMGKQGLGQMTENGELFADICHDSAGDWRQCFLRQAYS